MKQYNVTGMSCAACQARVEKAINKLPGVTSCSVSLLTNSMGVEGDVSDAEIIKAVENAGYNAKPKNISKGVDNISNTNSKDYDTTLEELEDKETPILKKRLFSSLFFLIVLMYFSMGHMFGIPMPDIFTRNPLSIALIQMLLAIIVMIINQKFFVNGFKGLIKGSPNMDTLVALGSFASFAYSTFCVFLMSYAIIDGNIDKANHYLHDLYFESAAMILALITVGKMLEARSKGKTTNALKGLFKLRPKTAVVIRNDEEITIPASDVLVDDIFIVKAGESFPTDGIIIDGHCSINESALTGESIPVDKTLNDHVYGATILSSGFVKCRCTKPSEDTMLSQIINMVSDAAATKAPIAKVADKVSGIFVPVVITISIITAVIWMLADESFGFALARAISVLVISCPCALGLATPVAIMVGNGVGAKNGILFKTAASLEEMGRIKIIALDKTGTITNGEPKVTDIICNENTDKETLLSYAYSLEIKSEHPLAKAIVSEVKENYSSILPKIKESKDFKTSVGNGLSGNVDGSLICGGNLKYISQKVKLNSDVLDKANMLSAKGKTPLFFTKDEEFLGIIGVADTVKADSPKAISDLKSLGLKVVMLTGDNYQTANAIKEIVGVDEVISDVLPDVKEEVIKKLKQQGKVAMVGDGINDAPALTSADIGIAIGAGTDVAIDAADVVLMKSTLTDVVSAVKLSRKVLRNIHENLFWAFIYNTIGIPVAAGVFIPLLGLKLSPMLGAAAMSLSSFCVVTNALRLNFVKLKSDKTSCEQIENKNIKVKETKQMEKTIKIEGMMCGHCEARVKKCLEAMEGVTEAIVSHETGTAIIKSEVEISDEKIKAVIEEQGYEVV